VPNQNALSEVTRRFDLVRRKKSQHETYRCRDFLSDIIGNKRQGEELFIIDYSLLIISLKK